MNIKTGTIVAFLALATLSLHVSAGPLWPKPVSTVSSGKNVTIDSSNFTIASVGYSSAILDRAYARYRTLFFMKITPFFVQSTQRVQSRRMQINSFRTRLSVQSKAVTDSPLTCLNVNVQSSDETLGFDTDESYLLVVSTPCIQLGAHSVYGAIRGLETLAQLIDYSPDTDSFELSEVTISDHPRFPVRGVLTDSVRHYLPPALIRAHLDAMSYNKMNLLHWHLSDTQSFPFVSSVYPELSEKGAYAPNHVYNATVVADLIQYARDRGIRIVPEFDTPGHVSSWGEAYPSLLVDCDPHDYSPLNVIAPETYTFVKNLFTEIGQVFPDQFFHVGGDEVIFRCWSNDPNIQAFMKQKGWTDYRLLQSYYESQLLPFMITLGKSPIVWQEIFNDGTPMPKDTIVDVWKSFDNITISQATQQGYRVLVSGGWYLDKLGQREGHSDWPSFYVQDPVNFTGTPQQKSLVIGGKACLWGELVDSTNFLSLMWPRASAVAERLWSQATVVDLDDADLRLQGHRCRMVDRGISASPIQPGFCLQEYNFQYSGPSA